MNLIDRIDEISTRMDGLVENVVILDHVDSTHSLALRLMEQMDNEELDLYPTIVLAHRQARGFGRGHRPWSSPPGGLYLDWIGTIDDERVVAQLPMLAAASAHAAVSAVGVSHAGIKWPNDILVGDRKLAGLLIHARRGERIRVAVGLGVNMLAVPDTFDDAIHPPVSLEELGGGCSSGKTEIDVAAEFVARLTASLESPASPMELWRQHLIHHAGDHMSVRLSSGSVESGTFAGLTDDGFLRLDTADGERIITGGDVIES
jgi:BirA family biotin operon repressor/biotin-[acetyl-CoA-carboxylase] ligase